MKLIFNRMTDELNAIYEESTKMNYEIRNVRDGDEIQLAFIQVESWRAAYGEILSNKVLQKYLDLEYVTAIYKKLLENQKGNGLIMNVEEQCHCMAYWDKARKYSGSDTAEIICIHSLKNNWRKGLGTKMMERICNDIAVQGYSQVILWVFEKNTRARLFYEANGFSATEKKQESFGETEICYCKNLKKI